MFYETLMEKRAKRNVNAPDVMLARLNPDDALKRRINADSRTWGGVLGAMAGVPTGVLVADALKDRKGSPRSRALAALGISAGGTALGAFAAPRLFPATDEYIKRLRASQAELEKPRGAER